MVLTIKADGCIIMLKDKEFLLVKMEVDIKDNGEEINLMVKENKLG